MKKILVPIDFGKTASNALKYALQVSNLIGSELIVAHVSNKVDEQLTERIKAFVERAMLKTKVKVDFETAVVDGKSVTDLGEGDLLDDIDLIIMGTKGASGLSELFGGTNTVSMIDNYNVPILVVPKKAVYRPLVNILFCSDFHEIENDNALDPLKQLAIAYDAEVRIAHIKTDGKHSSIEQQLERQREEYIFGDDVKHSYKRIFHKTILDGIQYYLDIKNDNSMIAVVSRQHNLMEKLLGSDHTRKLAFSSSLPLLVMHE